ncbi:metal ABC transporter substrate-binding protein [Dactylosporangium sp. NPDC050688]|uniref:metal ABC transporter substrate-binding protein n=1 Tax=Dactylosporangium sp. NPDC050688 TaxID=3157217 RepID=UPI0033EF7841
MRLQRSKVVAVSMLACAVTGALHGCSRSAEADAGKLRIVTTVAPLTSITSAVAGDRASVEGVVPEGTNSHTFDPSPKIAESLSRADVILINGLSLEDPTKRLAAQNKRASAEIVEVGTRILPREDWIFDFSFPEKDGKPNPHVWTDPTYAVKYAEVIRDTLAARDPANADYYRANTAAFTAAADRLAAALRLDQETIPAGGRALLTYHDAYAYFGRTFGWKIIGAVQPENFEDPSPSEVADLIEQIKAEKVRTIFGSEVFPSKVLEEVGRATGARYEDTLRDDDLPGEPGQDQHSWLGLMRYDFITMIKGLGGTTTNLDAVPLTQSTTADKAVYPQ